MLSSLKNLASSSAIKSAYTINDESGFKAGAWLVQDAIKKSTKQEVSVLTFSKKTLEQPLQRSSSALRSSFDTIYAQLKGEAATLARLRHPAMLEVVEPIEESRNTIMFVTERVTGCLSSMVADEDGDSFSNRRHRGDSSKLDEIEIQKGLLQVTIGLEFLQSVAQIVHGNLVPASIFINQKGDWKLGGFSFSLSVKDNPRYIPPDYDNRLPQSVQRNLDYAAPEFIIDETIDPLNDMFSLGCLICALVSSKRQPIIQCNQNIHLYRKAVEHIDVHSLPGIPPYLRDILPQLLTRRPANRLSAHAFQSSPFFDNILMNSIRFLDSFPEKTSSERQSFMRGLQSVIPQFPPRVLTKKILPGLMDQFQDHALLPLILPNIFLIAEGMTQKNFSESVLPRLRAVFKLTDCPGATMFLLEKMNSVLKHKITALELKEDAMTLIYTALTGEAQYLQEKALQVSAELVKDLDLVTVKSTLFPKIADVFVKTSMLGTKVTALETFNELVVHNLDKYTITEKLIPLMKEIKTKEPAIGMAALELSKSCGVKIDHENIALDLLPLLWSLALGPLLSQSQFQQFMKTIKNLSTQVETEQAKKLSDSGAPSGTNGKTSTRSGDLMDQGDGEEVSFENLVLGSKAKAAPMKTTPADVFSQGSGTAPAFSWSTPSQAPSVPAHVPQTTTAAATSRLSSYPALSPAPTGGSGRQTFTFDQPPLRPQAPQVNSSFGQASSTTTTRTTPNYNINQTGIDWSSATVKPSFISPPPPPPPSTQNQNQTFGGQFGTSTAATRPGFATPASGQANGQARKGLDSYQSLL